MGIVFILFYDNNREKNREICRIKNLTKQLCPKRCFSAWLGDTPEQSDVFATVIQKGSDCGLYSLIFIDCGIQEQVRILNEKGYKTIGCCESHYNGVCDNIYVAFGKDWDFQCMPEGFRYNQRRRMLIHDYKRYISESDFRREKEQYLAALLEWCRELWMVYIRWSLPDGVFCWSGDTLSHQKHG